MPRTDLFNENELLRRIANDDQRAFAIIVDHYTDIIYPYLVTYIRNASKAEEVTQDIFLRLWRNRDKLAGMQNFQGYLYVITRNRAKTALKEQLANQNSTWIDPWKDILANNGASGIEAKELHQTLQQGIEKLPPRRKEVFLLSRGEDLSYEQIAERLKISRSAVRQHIVEALAFLRTHLKETLGIIITNAGWIMLISDKLAR